MKVQSIALDKIFSSEINPRLSIDAESLADSVRASGILVPLLVKKATGLSGLANYTILAGHRRAAAAKIAGLESVPCIVETTANDRPDAMVHLVENIQRENLTPLETAIAVMRTIEAIGGKQADLAKECGKSAKWVSMYNTIGKFWTKQSEEIGEKMAGFSDADALYQFCKPQKPTSLTKATQADLVDEASALERDADESVLRQKIAEFLATAFGNVSVSIDDNGECTVKTTLQFRSKKEAEKFYSN